MRYTNPRTHSLTRSVEYIVQGLDDISTGLAGLTPTLPPAAITQLFNRRLQRHDTR